MRNRIAYSQNFLKNKGLVAELVYASSISSKDIVYEIGAGEGIITEVLTKRAKKVVAFEIDQHFFTKLTSQFEKDPKVLLKNTDFLTAALPVGQYKVFSNIPFNITSAIIKRLTSAQNPPEDMYLIIQKEAAQKFVGKPLDKKNSQVSIILNGRFEFEVIHQFKRTDFFPVARIDSILLRICKRQPPLISVSHEKQYEDFVVYAFNQFKPNIIEGLSGVFGKGELMSLSKTLHFSPQAKPSELTVDQWIGLFKFFITHIDATHQSKVKGAAQKLYSQQQKLSKINRTRVDSQWKRFKKPSH